jgi:AcrR family transcriptional regulator
VTNKVRSPGRRSGSEAARTRARILRVAERLFARGGYGGLAMRGLARACGVRMFTIQHHFGSKRGLYQECLRRGDREVRALLERILAAEERPVELVETIVDELFDFFLANRDWVALNARAALGDGLSRRDGAGDRSWVAFMDETMRERRIGAAGLDVPLLLITVEGILNNHALSVGHYQRLFGRDVTDARLAARAKAHLKQTILAILSNPGAGDDRRASREKTS